MITINKNSLFPNLADQITNAVRGRGAL